MATLGFCGFDAETVADAVDETFGSGYGFDDPASNVHLDDFSAPFDEIRESVEPRNVPASHPSSKTPSTDSFSSICSRSFYSNETSQNTRVEATTRSCSNDFPAISAVETEVTAPSLFDNSDDVNGVDSFIHHSSLYPDVTAESLAVAYEDLVSEIYCDISNCIQPSHVPVECISCRRLLKVTPVDSADSVCEMCRKLFVPSISVPFCANNRTYRRCNECGGRVFVPQESQDFPFSPSTSTEILSTGEASAAPDCNCISNRLYTSQESDSGVGSDSSLVACDTTNLGSFSSETSSLSDGECSSKQPVNPSPRLHIYYYKCDLCSRGFTSRNELDAHLSLHTAANEKPFICPICCKSFTHRLYLQRHINSHTGKKEHNCAVCQKSFKFSGHLKEHMRIHTGEKPYKCEICDQRFSQTSTLARHRIVHNNDRKYECQFCNRKFARNTQLVAHVRLHSGEQPFECKHCDMRFTTVAKLTRHTKMHEEQIQHNQSTAVAHHCSSLHPTTIKKVVIQSASPGLISGTKIRVKRIAGGDNLQPTVVAFNSSSPQRSPTRRISASISQIVNSQRKMTAGTIKLNDVLPRLLNSTL